LILNLLLCGCTEDQEYYETIDEKKSFFSSNKIIVGKNYSDANFTNIKDAIEFASDGDTIIVQHGIYQETLFVNKSISLVGEDRNKVILQIEETSEIIGGSETNNDRLCILTVNADNCTIRNLSFKRGIEDSRIVNGIVVNSSNNTIKGCILTNLYNAMDLLRYSNNNNILENIIEYNKIGIESILSKYNCIINNLIYNNSKYGLYFSTDSNKNTFSKNIFINNDYGVRIKGSRENELFYNYFSNNSYGLYLCCSARANRIYNNTFVNNFVYNAYEMKGLTNIWTASKSDYGNYWDDYTGFDENNDGIGDYSYSIPQSLRHDYYPLMEPLNVEYYFEDFISS
jgi:parallel beta-helix repeat protein